MGEKQPSPELSDLAYELAMIRIALGGPPPSWMTPEEVAKLLGHDYTTEQLHALDWERQLEPPPPDDLHGTVLRYDDPFGPACDPDDWEDNRDG